VLIQFRNSVSEVWDSNESLGIALACYKANQVTPLKLYVVPFNYVLASKARIVLFAAAHILD